MEKLKGDSNRETIELYLVSEEGMVDLTEKQKLLLKRWEYADELIRMKEIRSRETIAQLIMKRFDVSRPTAYQDIVNAEGVFSSSSPLNKQYRIGLRIEFLERKIDELYGNMQPFQPEDPEEKEDPMMKAMRIRENEEYIFQATQLEKTLQKYYQIYPDITPIKSPRTVIFNIQNNALPAAPMSAEEALQKGARIIDITPSKPNEPTDTGS